MCFTFFEGYVLFARFHFLYFVFLIEWQCEREKEKSKNEFMKKMNLFLLWIFLLQRVKVKEKKNRIEPEQREGSLYESFIVHAFNPYFTWEVFFFLKSSCKISFPDHTTNFRFINLITKRGCMSVYMCVYWEFTLRVHAVSFFLFFFLNFIHVLHIWKFINHDHIHAKIYPRLELNVSFLLLFLLSSLFLFSSFYIILFTIYWLMNGKWQLGT